MMTANKSKKRKQSLNGQSNPNKELNTRLKPNVADSILANENLNVEVNTEKPAKKMSKLNTENKQDKKVHNEQPKISLKNLKLEDEFNSKNDNKLTKNQRKKVTQINVGKIDNNENKLNIKKVGNSVTKEHDQNNHAITNRLLINANWEEFLAKSMNVDIKMEKPPEKIKKPKPRKKITKTIENSKLKPTTNTIDKYPNEVPNLKTEESTQIIEKPKDNQTKLTKFIAMDTEMVGIGFEGKDNMVARVSLVNKFGDCIYDKFVKPREPVVDYRTSVSGVRKEDLINGEQFDVVQKEVSEILRGKILIGHSVKNDLKVLFLSHPKKNIRDTTTYKPFRKITKSTPSLKRLTKEILGVDIQSGEHSSVEDARAVMKLYCIVAGTWEENLSGQRHRKKVFVN